MTETALEYCHQTSKIVCMSHYSDIFLKNIIAGHTNEHKRYETDKYCNSVKNKIK